MIQTKFIAVVVLSSIISILTIYSHPADPSALLSNYALFGQEYLNFTEEAETHELGWIGTNGYLNQGRSWVKFNSILKIKGSFDAGTNDMTRYKDTVYVKSSTTGDLSLVGDLLQTNASFPDPSLPSYGKSDITVDESNSLLIKGSQALMPGRYGRILLNDDNAEIVLTSGEYEIDTLIIRGTTRIPSLDKGVCRILVKSYLQFDNAGPNGHRLVAEDDALGKVLLFCAGGVTIDQGSRIDAALVAPDAHVSLATEIILNGQIHAKSITFRNGFNGKNGTFIPFNPGNLLFPEYLQEGVPEDSLKEPKSDNSYLLSFPLLLSNAGEYWGEVSYEVRSTSSKATAATEGEDFTRDTNGASPTGTIHFAPGDSVSSDSIHIWIIDDPKYESIEQIEVFLHSPDSLTLENGDSSISYFIPLESEDPEYNEMEGIGAAFDSVGDGLAHSITVELTEDLQESALTKLTYNWPNSATEKSVALGDITFLSNQSLSFPIVSNSGEGSGEGLLTLDDGTELGFSIVDSVGPVLLSGSAELLDTYSADTLTLSIREPISNFASSQEPQLIIFDDSSDTEGDTVKGLSVEKKSDLIYEVTLLKGTLSLGDWAQFNYASDITDLNGNSPATYNQKIQLNITVNKIPSFYAGALFDTNGPTGRLDGVADSGYVTIRLAADTARITMQDLTGLRLDPHNKNISLEWHVLNDSMLTFTNNNLIGFNSSAEILLEFETIDVEGTLKDSVAPVITAAQYEAWDKGDTLKVTFSEPLNDWGNLTPFLLHSGTTLKVQRKQVQETSVTYLVVGGSISESDSIWIAGDGEIADSGDVYQTNSNNQQVPLTILTIISPVEAAFFDTLDKPDGLIDAVRLTFNGTVTEAMVTALRKTVVLPSHRGISYRNSDVTVDGSEITFSLIQDTAAYRSTAVDSRDNISFDHTIYVGDTALYLDGSLPVADSMGPVVLSGFYSFGSYDELDPTINRVVDTLTVEYSEPVLIPDSDTPFGFIGADGNYEMSIVPGTQKGSRVAYERHYLRGDKLPELNDSLYLFGDQTLSDEIFVDQRKDTKPVPLLSNRYEQKFRFTVYPNPIVLDAFGQFTNNYLIYSGELDPANKLSVIVYPLGIRPVADTIAIDMVLLDPVGNEIFQQELVSPYRNEKGEWVFNVVPQNKNGRTPGRGSYSLQLKLTGAGETKHQQLLGVQQAIYPDMN